MSDTKPTATEEEAVPASSATHSDAATPPPEAEAAPTENLQALLEDARSKADAHWDQLLRLQAEMDNLRRRTERDVANAHKFALENFAQELLPVRDSLEMGLKAAEGDDENLAKLREGMELTLKMLAGVMEKFGIKAVGVEGEKFNPDLHQAMTLVPSPDHAPDSVVTVYQKGYLLNERLLRPAMVVVAAS